MIIHSLITRFSLVFCVLSLVACIDEIVLEADMGGESTTDKTTPETGFGGQAINNTFPGTNPNQTGGGTNPLNGGTSESPPVGGTSSPTGGSSIQCTPGTLIGTCERCGLNGINTVPERDEVNCPVFDCSEHYRFSQVALEDGQVECRIQTSEPVASNCEGLGACIHSIESYCEYIVQEAYWEPVPYNDCQYIEGCTGQTEPELFLVDEGEPCQEGMGTCDGQGECILTNPVEPDPVDPPVSQVTCTDVFGSTSYNGNNILCEENPLPDQLVCTYYLEKNSNPYRNGNRFSCQEFCTYHNATCVTTWNDNERNHCEVLNTDRNCNDRGLDAYVCQCQVPVQP